MMRRLIGWETLIALLVGGCAGFYLPNNFYDKTTSELVTLLSILMAAVVPAMLLGATALRAGNFSVKRLSTLTFAVDRQIASLGGLFLYASVANIVTISGKALEWSLPSVETRFHQLPVLKLDAFYPAVLSFLIVFLFLRSISVIAGVRSIARLSAAIAIDEARQRDESKSQAAVDEIKRYELPKTYGARIELPQ